MKLRPAPAKKPLDAAIGHAHEIVRVRVVGCPGVPADVGWIHFKPPVIISPLQYLATDLYAQFTLILCLE